MLVLHVANSTCVSQFPARGRLCDSSHQYVWEFRPQYSSRDNLNQFDFTAMKEFPVTEAMRLQSALSSSICLIIRFREPGASINASSGARSPHFEQQSNH